LMKGHDILAGSATAAKALDAKTRELIAIAVAATTRCDGCLTVHTQAAKDPGASKEEIMEALTVAVALNAGAALVYSARAIDALKSAV
ncbi:MAG TPA: carboxymuconolactone decarboxylase family protein, partial [Hansschlegelia sp.]